MKKMNMLERSNEYKCSDVATTSVVTVFSIVSHVVSGTAGLQ